MNWLYRCGGLSDQALEKLITTHNRVIDQRTCGDYELCLILFEPIGIYQVAIQRKGLDFSDIEQQMTKQKIKIENVSDWEQIKSTLNEWKSKYGSLRISTHNPARIQKYFNILALWGFNPEWEQFGPTKAVRI